MKKEGGAGTQEIDAQYGLDKYPKTEFVKQICKEFWKNGKKLQKIATYEEMLKQGKTLNKEMQELITKKESLSKHLESLKSALEIYHKSGVKLGEPEVVAPDTTKEVEEKVKEFISQASKKLGFFFTIAFTLSEKERISSLPLEKLPSEEQGKLCKLYKEIVQVQEDKETTLESEAMRSAALISGFLQKSEDTVAAIMNDKSIIEYHYKISAPKLPANQYSVSQPISIGKNVVPEVPKKEEPAPIQEPVKIVAAPVKEPELKVVPEVKPPVESSWIEGAEPDEEEPEVAPEMKPYQPETEAVAPEEDEFEIATDKSEERKKQMAQGASQVRGRGRGRGRGFRRGRGEFRGEYRGEGMRRPRGPRRGGDYHNTRGQQAA